MILPGFGLLLIILNIIFFKSYFPHQSIYTLPSIIGVCLIICFSQEGEFVTKILSSKITSVSSGKQKKLTKEIKKAKLLGLI